MNKIDVKAARKQSYRYGRQIWQSSRDGKDASALVQAAANFMAQFKDDPTVAAYVKDAYHAGIDGDTATDEANGFLI